ncbi:PREDICTED: autism susceptibility gene 2 protein-like isoform X3 [Cyprinodon variegatus]|uniref:autism susceptibility gene 2 protein-like isoform X3 n=1 Tax=Cyprinodon variegatus TaxID=28743 RepID=UPI0007429290|nr:PREDICTED: autism susceptibility gene 2 protein-like isoform X3 [Cyprinodon variegatus]
MEGPSRSSGMRKSRRSRSQRDRELRRRRRVNLAEERATSLSSGSDREGHGTNGVLGSGGRECRPGFGRHRPPRRRKRESVSCEEDIIDGFAIASFISLEALEMDCSLKPNQRDDILRRQSRGKRGPEENGGGLLSEPEEGAPHSYSSSYLKRRNKRRKIEGSHLETGYICDTESDTGDKASDNEMDPVFTVSTRKAVEPSPSNLGTSGKSCPPPSARCGGISRLMVTPRVSGLERSQEKSLESHLPEPVPSSTSSGPNFPCLAQISVTASVAVPRPSPVNGNSTHHNGTPSLPGPPPSFLELRRSGSGRLKLPTASSVASSSSSICPPTPSTSVSMRCSRGLGSSGPLRPPSRASSGNLYTSSPGLPPPPPLLPPAHPAAAEREGRRSVPGAENNSAAAGRNTPGGPSAPNSASSSSGRTSQNVPPLAFQFHQHNHQHQHTHTHQHFTPFPHLSATAQPMFDKFPGKMEGLYRHPFFQYPPPPVSNIPPVIPPAGPFSSLQGAFQPKGTAPDITARLGVVPHHLQTKDHRLNDPYVTSLKTSNKPGKWCAMHVHVAWMILSHQRKVKLMQADPHKLDFRSDLLRYSGPVGLGGSMPPTHDLTRPPSLFPATGPVNPSAPHFLAPSASHPPFLPPGAHLDPYGRSPPFAPLGALGSAAFGGLGSPALAGSVFSSKDAPPGGMPTSNHHEAWNIVRSGPSGFPGGPWVKGVDKRDERERGKELDRREMPHIKDEKDRYCRLLNLKGDSLMYGRQPVRMSPAPLTFKPRSSTPVNHINGHSSSLGGSAGAMEDLTRSLNRDRDRDGDKRPLPTASSRAPLGSSSLVADRDRPRSSSSSVLTTPPPSHRSISSPLDIYSRSQAQTAQNLHNDHSQRDGNLPASSAASSSISSLSHAKKSDRTTTPVSKTGLLLPPVKVKEERKEEPEHIPITLPPPAPGHAFDRPSSHPHHPSSGTPSSCSLSLTPTPGVSLPPPTLNPPPHLPMLERSRIEALLGSAQGVPGLTVGLAGERFSHGPPPGPPQGPHGYGFDPWGGHRREPLALRSDPHLALRTDPHLARLLHQRQLMEAERAATLAAAAAPHHPPTSTSASSAIRPEFGLMTSYERSQLLDEEQRALRESFGASYFAMHPHLPPGSHLSSPSHAAAAAAHLDQLHQGLLPHHGAGPGPQHHPSLYSRLGPINPHAMSNGMLAKDLMGALSVGAPPPLIPSIASRSATPPRTSRLGGPGELALYSTHKDGESR